MVQPIYSMELSSKVAQQTPNLLCDSGRRWLDVNIWTDDGGVGVGLAMVGIVLDGQFANPVLIPPGPAPATANPPGAFKWIVPPEHRLYYLAVTAGTLNPSGVYAPRFFYAISQMPVTMPEDWAVAQSDTPWHPDEVRRRQLGIR